MKLQRLRVEQLRLFQQPLEISDFAPGLNLFSGPNESGKSSLVRAVRAVFFERHRSSSVDDLQPWGDSSAAPEVALDFEHGGQLWRLTKRFLQKKRCDLNIAGESFSGEDAEQKLADLLGFQYSGSGASKARHWGIPGLLWIEQGQGQDLRESIEFASDHLNAALGATLGEIASSSGDDIIKAVEEQRAAWLTKTGRPTGEYKEAEDKLSAATASLQELDARITHYQVQVDRLGELRAQQQRDEAERPWEGLRLQLEQARQQYAAVSTLNEQQAADTKTLHECEQTIHLVTEQLAGFQKQTAALQQRTQAQVQAQAQLAQLQDQKDQLLAKVQDAKAAYQHARDLVQASRRQSQRVRLTGDIEQLTGQHQKLEQSLAKARTLQRELLGFKQQLLECSIDAKDLKQLKKLDGELRELTIKQQSIATRLQFELQSGAALNLDGDTLTGFGERLLLEQADLDIPGVGTLLIVPGGEDLGDLARRLDQSRDNIAALLQKLQVDSLDRAEQRAERARVLQNSIASHQPLLHSHAPEGIDALEAAMKRIEPQLQTLQQQLADLPEPETDIPSPERAEQQLENTSEALKHSELAEQQYQRDWVAAEQRASSAATELAILQAALADPQHIQREQDNARRLTTLRADEVALNAALAQRNATIAAARPDILQQDIQRLDASANQAESAFNARKLALATLESELITLGANGLEEQKANLLVTLEALTRRHAELQRRAAATDLLLNLLREKRQQLTRQLQAPLQRHLNHYLQLLFPQASLEVDENLIPGKLQRPGAQGRETGPYGDLSFGAREQMGLISRLAYADLLKEAGKPTLIILDDALVHSDHGRLQQMKRILFDASHRHQILLFTCHPEKWADMGVGIRELASLTRL